MMMDIRGKLVCWSTACTSFDLVALVYAMLVVGVCAAENSGSVGDQPARISEPHDRGSIKSLSAIIDRAKEQQQPSLELLDWLSLQSVSSLNKADRIIKQKNLGYSRERRFFIERWVDLDPVQAVEMNPRDFTFAIWAGKSPQAALDWLKNEFELHPAKFKEDEKFELLSGVANQIAVKDPMQALLLIRPFGDLGERAMQQMGRSITSRGFNYSIEWIKMCPFESLRSSVFEQLGERFPRQASDLVTTQEEFSNYINYVASGRFENDPRDTLDWLGELPQEISESAIFRLCDEKSEHVRGALILVDWLIAAKDQGRLDFARLNCGLILVTVDPVKAVEISLNIKNESRWWTYQTVMAQWKNSDMRAANKWVEENRARIPIPTEEERSYQYIDGK